MDFKHPCSKKKPGKDSNVRTSLAVSIKMKSFAEVSISKLNFSITNKELIKDSITLINDFISYCYLSLSIIHDYMHREVLLNQQFAYSILCLYRCLPLIFDAK